MLRDPLSSEAPGQRPRIMDPLRSVQSEVAVHSQERQFERNYKDREPRDGVAHVATTTSVDGRVQTQCCDLPGNAEEDRRRGDPDDDNQQGGGDSNGLSGLPESKGKPDACISIDSVTKFPLECGDEGINPEELHKHLTSEEKAQMAQILRERQAASNVEDINENEMA